MTIGIFPFTIGENSDYLLEINHIYMAHSVLVFIHLMTAIIIVIIDYSFI